MLLNKVLISVYLSLSLKIILSISSLILSLMYFVSRSNSLYSSLGPIPNLNSLDIFLYLFISISKSSFNLSISQPTASVLIIMPRLSLFNDFTNFFSLNLSFSSDILFDIVILSFDGIKTKYLPDILISCVSLGALVPTASLLI